MPVQKKSGNLLNAPRIFQVFNTKNLVKSINYFNNKSQLKANLNKTYSSINLIQIESCEIMFSHQTIQEFYPKRKLTDINKSLS